MRRFDRFACLDWSGARGTRHRGIALATCAAGRAAPTLVDPPCPRGWSRQEVLDWLLNRAAARDDLLVGVDFSAALPFTDLAAYLPGITPEPDEARALWGLVDARCSGDPDLGCDGFLADPDVAAHFRIGARTGARFAGADRNGRLRAVEREPASGRPASCFNLVGPAQVGRSSITGMRLLHRLGGRLSVWPFDPLPPSGPLLVEIYTGIAAVAAGRPRHATKMRCWESLDEALVHPAIDSDATGATGVVDDHRSDAILTAAWLRRAARRVDLWSPERLTPALARTEGWTFGVP